MIVFGILQKVLVNHFYKVNAGFFLFIFFVLFGLPYQPLNFHRSLINGILESQVFLAVVMLGWLLYTFKCLDYIIRQVAAPKQTFLFCLNNLPIRKVWLYMVFVQMMVYLPALFYAGVIMVLAAYRHLFGFAFEIFVFTIAMLVLPARLYLFVLQKQKIRTRNPFPALFLKQMPKPLFLLPLFYLWHNRKQMLLVTKMFTIGFLYLFISLYEPDYYDIRPLLLCLLVVVAAHSATLFEAKQFGDDFLLFSRNLPLNTLKRFGGLLIMLVLLMLPEMLFIWKGFGLHFHLKDYPQLLLFVIGLMSFFYAVLYIENNTMDQFIRTVFIIMAVLFFIILYNPGILLPVGLLLLAGSLFSSYYYSFEKKV